jgi:hypothetical protein
MPISFLEAPTGNGASNGRLQSENPQMLEAVRKAAG